MKIVRIELTPVATRQETGAVSRHVIVRVRTAEGITGTGEMSDKIHHSSFVIRKSVDD